MEEDDLWWNLLNMLEEDDTDEAYKFLKKHSNIVSKSQYKYMLLFIQAQRGNFAEAEEGIIDMEKRSETILWEARAFLAMKQTDFEKVVKYLHMPDEITTPATYMLHEAYFMLEKYEESFEWLLLLKDYINSYIFDIRYAKCMEGMKSYKKAAEIYKEHNLQIQYARVLALSGLYSKSKKVLKKYMKKHEQKFINHEELASAFNALGEHKAAINNMRIKIKNTKPRNRNFLYFKMAKYQYNEGNFKKCINLLKKSKLDIPTLHGTAGYAYMKIGEFKNAASEFENAGMRLNAAIAFYHAGKINMAKKILKELEDDGEDSSIFYNLLAQIYSDDEKLQKRYLVSYRIALDEEKHVEEDEINRIKIMRKEMP